MSVTLEDPTALGWPPKGLSTLRLVQSPRALRKFAWLIGLAFLMLPIAMVVVPWQQNIQGGGSVTALSPVDRPLVIPAPVTGRLVKLYVQDGSLVDEGQVLAEMADQDPQYAARLEQQIEFAQDKFQAATDMVEFYDQQLGLLESAREQSISSANYVLNTATEELRSLERELEGLEAELAQKRADWERKERLLPDQVVSELEFQKAEASYLSARAKVAAAEAKVEKARNQESAKRVDVSKIANDQQAKIESTKSSREDARSKVALADGERNKAMTAFERQKTRIVVAPRRGYVLSVLAASSADLVSRGAPLIEFIPDTTDLAVEIWVRGIDASLVSPGRKARLQFEGWPAVQFSGWPSIAVGTFGGVVSVVDARGATDGSFRVLVVPDPDDAPWPDRKYLRQGVRANAWLLLDTVSLGFEIWRQINAFPPSMRVAPDSQSAPKASKTKSDSQKKGEKE